MTTLYFGFLHILLQLLALLSKCHLESDHFSPPPLQSPWSEPLLSLIWITASPQQWSLFLLFFPLVPTFSAQPPCLIRGISLPKTLQQLKRSFKPHTHSVQALRACLLFLKHTHLYSFFRAFALSLLSGMLLPRYPLGYCPWHFQIISQISSAQQGLPGACF